MARRSSPAGSMRYVLTVFSPLHDRRRRKSRGNIDHIVVARGGVYVVDSKRYRGRVRIQTVGGRFDLRDGLYVDRRDCTALAGKVRAQAAEVAQALEHAGWQGVSVQAVLCFIGAEWGLFPRAFVFDRVLVSRPGWLLASVLQAEKMLSFDSVCSIDEFLADRFPPA